MTAISVCIPVVSGGRLGQVLESLRRSTFQDFEVVVANSSTRPQTHDKIVEFGAKEVVVPYEHGLLGRRREAHALARGDKEFLLEETRSVDPSLFRILSESSADLISVGEKEDGSGLLSRLAELDKRTGNEGTRTAPDPATNSYVFPRLFPRAVLNRAFETAFQNIGAEKFSQVIYGDHQILSYEARKLTRTMEMIRTQLLTHYGDASLSELVRKYHAYGKSARVLKDTTYETLLRVANHNRPFLSMKSYAGSLTMLLIRGVPYAVGYALG